MAPGLNFEDVFVVLEPGFLRENAILELLFLVVPKKLSDWIENFERSNKDFFWFSWDFWGVVSTISEAYCLTLKSSLLLGGNLLASSSFLFGFEAKLI